MAEADLAELEGLISECKRPRVKAQLEAYAVQLRELIGDATAPAKPAAAAAAAAASTAPPASAPSSSPPAPAPVPLSTEAAAAPPSVPYSSITSFAWDQDDYGKDPANVYVHLLSGFEGIGEAKESVQCDFGKRSFDLRVLGYKGKNWRLRKDGLDKEIDPAGSRVKVGKNKITVVLRKVKGQYGADHWMDLVAKRTTGGATQDDPSAGLMDMMKQMYDEGDDNMKKTLGEAMLKSRQEQMRGGKLGDDL